MESGKTALHLAAESGNFNLVHTLLNARDSETDVNSVTENAENTALHYAASLRNSNVLHLLLMGGANSNIHNASGLRPLNIAIKEGRIANAVILISFGAKLSLADVQATDPIQHATAQTARHKRYQMAAILQKRFAAVESPSPSMVLTWNVSGFVQSNGTIDLKSGMKWAAGKGDLVVCNYLLDIDPELKNSARPLHIAAESGHLDLVDILISEMADVNAANRFGRTPLHLAARKGHDDIVPSLLAAGASKTVKTKNGHTPADLARKAGHQQIANKLICQDQHMMQIPVESACVSGDEDNNDSSLEPGKATHDGKLMGNAIRYSEGSKRGKGVTVARLSRTGKDQLNYKTSIRRIKVAVLDTGIDPDSCKAEGRKDNPVKGRKNFARNVLKRDDDVSDLSGHGTQVAGLILDIAPNTDLYIARICDGDVDDSKRTSNDNSTPKYQVDAPAQAVNEALNWAIEQRVHIINLSFGFEEEIESIKATLKRANKRHILVFSAMNNDGNHTQARWPARDIELTIGIHASKQYGGQACAFAGRAVPSNPNFMVRGEDVTTRWLKDERRLAEGSSYASPIAASMAALILQFERQKSPKFDSEPQREWQPPQMPSLRGGERLGERKVMIQVLEDISEKSQDEKFLWIHPKLLWKDVTEDTTPGGVGACKIACEVLQKAIDKVT